MSHPSRPRARGPEQRRSRAARIEAVTALEERQLLAPVLAQSGITATFTPLANQPKTQNLGNITLTTALPVQTGAVNPLSAFPEAASITSVSELTTNSSFGGDIVRIRSGSGGDFGNSLYAVSRGAGDNLTKGAINRPGVIYRVDTATGKSSVFFDLNTVISQLDPTQTSAAGGLTPTSGLTNFYDISFDPEGYFDGRPSMFVSSADATNPAKNAIYRIAPDGTFLGAFTTFSDTTVNAAKLTFNPTSILVPPPEQQTFLRGLIAGTGSGSVTGQGFLGGATATGSANGGFGSFNSTTQFAALYFDSNQFRPGTPINSLALPLGVKQTGLTLGPQVGLTAANTNYASAGGSLVYDVFADFGTPGFAGVFTASSGVSGVQGINGDLLINRGFDPNAFANTVRNPTPNIDLYPAASTNFRRFQDVAFDQYGFFSQGLPLTTTTTGAGATTGTGGAGGGAGGGGGAGTGTGTGTVGTGPIGSPIYAGSLFAADLATGLAVSVAVPGAPANTPPALIPVQGPGFGGISSVGTDGSVNFQAPGSFSSGPNAAIGGDLIGGGRIVRIDQFGRLTTFAEGFNTSNASDGTSFSGSSLSITFSSDGTTLYASDDDGIWQFKTTASLAGSSSGSIVGLNDLRTLGVPYDGRNSAVDVIDTGIDSNNPSFRGRVATGTSTAIPGGTGKDDLAAGISGVGSTTGTGTGTGNNTGGNNNGNNAVGGTVLALNADGHGTPVAGVIAQFVPQATLNPINVFEPFVTLGAGTTTGNNTGGGGVGGVGGGGFGFAQSFPSNASATTDSLFAGFQYAANNPYVADPIRPLNQDRVIAASLAFGTTETFATEQTAYRQYPQVVIAFKNQLDKFLKAGIAPIGAAGQLGATAGASSIGLGGGGLGGGGLGGGGLGGGGVGGGGVGGGGIGGGGGFGGTFDPNVGPTNNSENTSLGDLNGMSLPAVLNEVISVTGTYPFLYTAAANTPPTDPAQTVLGRFRGPVLVFGNNSTSIGGIGDSGLTGNGNGTATGTGTATGGNTTGGNTTGANGTTGAGSNNLALLTAAESGGGSIGGGGTGNGGGGAGGAGGGPLITFSDRLLGSANRNATTDFAAPALDAPTFRRTFVGDGFDPNVFLQGGTSISSAIVTGSYALVSSALEYWSNISKFGLTASAYLTTPVGAHVLNYGNYQLFNPKAYNNPNGINSILAYSAVPAADINDNLTVAGPPTILGTNTPRTYARVSVSNAIATIEGKIAIDYLLKHGTFNIIDANHDGLITSQEIQNFVDSAAVTGQPEAGAMARLLGGTARGALNNTFTAGGEQPDQPDVLQRRFNFFDYAVHGKLQGSVSIAQFRLLNKYILPTPDAFSITDRQRASANGFLIAPGAQRNFRDLQRLKPSYEFVPKGSYVRYKGTTPAQFGVNHNNKAASTISPVYTLFNGGAARHATKVTPPAPVATPATPPATTTPAAATASATSQPTTGTAAVAPTSVTNPPAATPATPVTNPTAPTESGTPVASTTTTQVTTTTVTTSPATPTSPNGSTTVSPAVGLVAPIPATPATPAIPATPANPAAPAPSALSVALNAILNPKVTNGALTPGGPPKNV